MARHRVNRIVYALGQLWFWPRRIIWRKRLSQTASEHLCDHDITVLPEVFNPVLFRTGKLFAEFLDDDYLSKSATQPLSVLDVGTGSGILALVSAARGHDVTATDLNPVAVQCANLNVSANGYDDVVEVFEGDLFEPVAGRRFDLVLWNPPYFEGEPDSRFDMSWRSTDSVERFFAGVGRCLAPDGRALLIWSSQRPEALLQEQAQKNNLQLEVLREHHLGVEIVSIFELRPVESVPAAVSIVISTFDREALLREAIESIRAQDWDGEIELIVIDSGTTSDTSDWLTDADSPILYQRMASDSSLAAKRNRGASMANGNFVLFFDDDDLLEPSAIRDLMAAMDANAQAGFAFGRCQFFTDDNSKLPAQGVGWEDDESVLFNLVSGRPLLVPTIMWRRAAIEATGRFDQTLGAAEDYDFCLRAASVAEGVLVPGVVARIRRHADSMSHRRALAGTANAAAALERMTQDGGLDRRHAKALCHTLARLYLSLSRMHAENGDREKAGQAAAHTVKLRPAWPRGWTNLARRYLGSANCR